MSKLDGINLYCDVTEDALNAWKAIKDKFPSVGDFNKTPEKLIAMGGENADVIGLIIGGGALLFGGYIFGRLKGAEKNAGRVKDRYS